MNQPYLEFRIPAIGNTKDMLISELAEDGFEGFVEHDDGFSAFIPENIFLRRRFEDLIHAYEIPLSRIIENKIEQRNWNAEWEASYEPICIHKDIYIRTPFHPAMPDFKHQLTIQPKMSFGTGHHETTRLMLQLMLAEDFKNKYIFDYGCGTGVLSVMASVLGATEIFAVDIDDWAAENLYENAQLNDIKNIVFEQGDIDKAKGKIFNLVLANINKNILTATMAEMASTIEVGGLLLMSGFYENDVDDLLSVALPYGLTLNQKINENDWTAMVLVKK
ncbi:MAG: 50S ribosomal protein L11 methyltransferase [Bacteroidota bacterium]|nr:50S ribosomal protein L11 methyltransferase [Bacteroidota bacterium]